MRYRRFPGFLPLNAYSWEDFGFWRRLDMLIRHAKFIPLPVRLTWSAWRINRTQGPHWPYPWERHRSHHSEQDRLYTRAIREFGYRVAPWDCTECGRLTVLQ